MNIGLARIRVGFNFLLINSAFTLVLMKYMYVEWIVFDNSRCVLRRASCALWFIMNSLIIVPLNVVFGWNEY